MATHIFISYVHDDAQQVERICEALKAYDIDVWLDKERIMPAMRWQDSIRQAISQGAFFMACFSKQYWSRNHGSFMNTELSMAIEELGKRRHNQQWFIPVRLDDCEVPDRSIGPGETLKHLQYVDLFGDKWSDGMRRILTVLMPIASPEFSTEARRWIAEEYRINRALQVYDEWHTPRIHESRIQVSNFLELLREGKILSLPTLTDFEVAQRESNALTPYADHFFRVIHFFERWALLYADNLLDHARAARLLGSYVKWYRERLLAPLEIGETNPDFIRLLKVINAMASTNEIQNQISDADPV